MAVRRVFQREIVEVPYRLPDGQVLVHPALVLSVDELQDYEDGMFYAVLISTKNHFPHLTLKIQNEWLNKPLSKQSYFVTHIVSIFNVDDVMTRYNNYIKLPYFDKVLDKVISNIFGRCSYTLYNISPHNPLSCLPQPAQGVLSFPPPIY